MSLDLKTPISQIVPDDREIIAFQPSLSVGDALQVLGHYELFGAPVVSKKGNPLGYVDYLDLLCFLIEVTSKSLESRVTPPSRNLKTDDLELILRRANDWNLTKLVKKGVIRISKKEPFFYSSPGDSILHAITLFGRGVHHMLIVNDKTKKVLNVVSPTDFIRYLSKDLNLLGKLGGKTLSQVDLGKRPVFCVRNTDSAIDAFYELFREGVTGGAIINSEGKLVGNFSASDLLGTQGHGFTILTQSIMVYQRKHRVALAERLVTVSLETSVADVVATMAREGVHRVFVVKGGMFPIGLVTQTDICRIVSEALVPKKKQLTKKEIRKSMESHMETKLVFPSVFPPQ